MRPAEHKSEADVHVDIGDGEADAPAEAEGDDLERERKSIRKRGRASRVHAFTNSPGMQPQRMTTATAMASTRQWAIKATMMVMAGRNRTVVRTRPLHTTANPK
jgi:hypothetical protein